MASVLIVDDDPGIVELFSRFLDSKGYTVSTASDGPGAIQKAQEDRPDTVLLGEEDGMSSIQAFRCGRCRADVLATARRAAPYWSIGPDRPVLCCGQPLRLLEFGQVLSLPLPRLRRVRCPRCGFAVWVIVQPVGALACAGCQAECVVAFPDSRAAAMEGGPSCFGRR